MYCYDSKLTQYTSLFSHWSKRPKLKGLDIQREPRIVVLKTLDTSAPTVSNGDPKTSEVTAEGIRNERAVFTLLLLIIHLGLDK